MGSSGQRRRKGNKHPQHLSKVGSSAGTEKHMRSERRAVADQMGLSHKPAWLRFTAMALVVLLVVGAISGLLLLTVFK